MRHDADRPQGPLDPSPGFEQETLARLVRALPPDDGSYEPQERGQQNDREARPGRRLTSRPGCANDEQRALQGNQAAHPRTPSTRANAR